MGVGRVAFRCLAFSFGIKGVYNTSHGCFC